MTTVTVVDRLLDGRQALETARWDDARAAFEDALATLKTPDARDGLGQALWFLGDVEDGIAQRARAFEGYVRDGRCEEAARVAVWVSHQHFISGRASAARGWLARAERVVEAAGRAPATGGSWWSARATPTASRSASSTHGGRCRSPRSRTTATSRCSRSACSAALRSARGAAMRGWRCSRRRWRRPPPDGASNLHTLGEAYCNLIAASAIAGEWERASEWCAHVDAFAREIEAAPLLGACSTVHADLLLAAGRWTEAEQALQSALAAHARHMPAMGAPAIGALAELRVRQGRLPEAEQLLAGRESHPASLRAVAQLRIAEGRPQVAAALLQRGLAAAGEDAMRVMQLLGPLVDAQLACGDVASADIAATALAELARSSQVELVAARADLAAARVALAAGRPGEAAGPASRALEAFSRLSMPLDVGEARLELARALATDAPELALDDARAAFAAFQELGASRAMDAAAAVLRDLGGGTAPRARAYGELTAREQEVLGLLGLGMSNARIAQTLVISEKTAGHHVSRILSKLGVSNRAQAAAHAARTTAL